MPSPRPSEPSTDTAMSQLVRLRIPALVCRGCAHRLLSRLRRAGISADAERDELSLRGDVLGTVEMIRAWGFSPESASVRLPIMGTTGSMDAELLETTLRKVPGVLSADVDLLAARADLELLPDLVDIDTVRTAASRIGYNLSHPTVATPPARASAAPAMLSTALALAATATLLAPQEWLGPVAAIGVNLAGGALAVAASVTGAARTVVAGILRITRRTLDPASLLAFAIITALAGAAVHLFRGTSPAFAFLTAAWTAAAFAVSVHFLRRLRDRDDSADAPSLTERTARVFARRLRFTLLAAAPAVACASLIAGRSPAQALDAAAIIFGTASIPLQAPGMSALRWVREALRGRNIRLRSSRTAERLATLNQVVLLDSVVENGPSRLSDSVLLGGVTRDHLLACAASAAAAGTSSALRAIARRTPATAPGCRVVAAGAPEAERHLADVREEVDSYTAARKSPYLVLDGDRLLGLLAVERPVIEELPAVASDLRELSVTTAVVTELEDAPARAVAGHAGVTLIASGTPPEAVRSAMSVVSERDRVAVVGSDPFAAREELFVALSKDALADVEIRGSVADLPPLVRTCRTALDRMRTNTRAAAVTALLLATAGAAAASFSLAAAVPVLFGGMMVAASAFIRSTRGVAQ